LANKPLLHPLLQYERFASLFESCIEVSVPKIRQYLANVSYLASEVFERRNEVIGERVGS
jgi:hypothetical protein